MKTLTAALCLILAMGGGVVQARSCGAHHTHRGDCGRPATRRLSVRSAVVKALAPGVGPTMAGAPRCKPGASRCPAS